MGKARCPRCGKKIHEGPCPFDKAKKSVIEDQTEKIKSNTDKLKTK